MSITEMGLQAVRRRIALAAEGAGRRPDSVELVAVTKTFPATVVVEAYGLGQVAFGESYAQEAVEKIAAVRALLERASSSGAYPVNSAVNASAAPAGPPRWHFIGPVQSNKTRLLAEHVDWVHSIDRLKIAQRLSDQRPAQLPELQVCIQVNVSAEGSKGGVQPDGARSLAEAIVALPHLRLRGLMAIPEPTPDGERQRSQFAHLRKLLTQLNSQGMRLDTLSMGMSDDLEAAIAEGATIVRVGRAIFGERV